MNLTWNWNEFQCANNSVLCSRWKSIPSCPMLLMLASSQKKWDKSSREYWKRSLDHCQPTILRRHLLWRGKLQTTSRMRFEVAPHPLPSNLQTLLSIVRILDAWTFHLCNPQHTINHRDCMKYVKFTPLPSISNTHSIEQQVRGWTQTTWRYNLLLGTRTPWVHTNCNPEDTDKLQTQAS